MKVNYLLFALALMLFSCNSDDDQPTGVTVPETEGVILVGNEGSFMADNASLTLVDRGAETATQNVYASANDDAELGDVLQSMYAYQNEIYVVVNNSGKIEVLDKSNLTSKRTISGMSSPRFMLFESADKAYVTDLYDNGIHIVNPSTGTYSSLINTGFWIEHMISHNNEIWCSAPNKDKVFFLDAGTQLFTDSLTLSQGVSDMGMDANNDFWIMSQGTWSEPYVEPAIHHVDGDTKALIASYDFPAGTGFGGNLAMSGDKQSVIYLLEGKIYKMDITATSLPGNPFIEKSGSWFYTLSVNGKTGEIAATDALDFSQAGKVYFYTSGGEEIDNYATGIAPRSVLWLED